ncbi:MAG: hypothetical protein QXD04_04395 [Candidatus Bathyarchaeia archaeon]
MMKIRKLWIKLHFKCYGTMACDSNTSCPIESECLHRLLENLRGEEETLDGARVC